MHSREPDATHPSPYSTTESLAARCKPGGPPLAGCEDGPSCRGVDTRDPTGEEEGTEWDWEWDCRPRSWLSLCLSAEKGVMATSGSICSHRETKEDTRSRARSMRRARSLGRPFWVVGPAPTKTGVVHKESHGISAR